MSLVHNERTKLTAGFLNTTAVAILAAGLIGPFFAALYGMAALTPEQIRFFAIAGPVWLLIGAGLHHVARFVLGGLKE